MRNTMKKLVAGVTIGTCLFGFSTPVLAGPVANDYESLLERNTVKHTIPVSFVVDNVRASGLDIKPLDVSTEYGGLLTTDKDTEMIEVYADELPVTTGYFTIYDIKKASDNNGWEVQYSTNVTNSIDENGKLVCQAPIVNFKKNSGWGFSGYGSNFKKSGYYVEENLNAGGGYYPQIGEKLWTGVASYDINENYEKTGKNISDNDVLYLSLKENNRDKSVDLSEELKDFPIKVIKLHVQNKESDSTPNQNQEATNTNEIKVTLNEKALSFSSTTLPRIENGSTLLPLRAIADALGLYTNYNSTDKLITIKGDNTELQMKVGEKSAIVNGKIVELNTPAKVIDGTTFVPVRFIAEAFSCKVDYNANSKTVSITK